MLDETNIQSFLPDKRSAQHDYYLLQNRETQLKAVANLSPAELAYVGGTAEAVSKSLSQIHEKDLIELKCLVYLNKLPDTSAELLQMKAWCGCDTREAIARYLADKQIKKLMMSQIEAVIDIPQLTKVYKKALSKGASTFGDLFGAGSDISDDQIKRAGII